MNLFSVQSFFCYIVDWFRSVAVGALPDAAVLHTRGGAVVSSVGGANNGPLRIHLHSFEMFTSVVHAF